MENLKYLEEQLNLLPNFFLSCNNPEEMLDTLGDHLIDYTYSISPPTSDTRIVNYSSNPKNLEMKTDVKATTSSSSNSKSKKRKRNDEYDEINTVKKERL